MNTIKVAVSGCTGRMGRMITEAVRASDDLQLALLLAPEGELSKVAAREGEAVSSDPEALAGVDVLIDFTRPAGTLAYLEACVRHGTACVIGTTGFDAEGKAAIARAAEAIPVVFAPNMCTGVNVTFKLVEIAAKLLAEYDCEILEMHHRHKVDAPSGTALELGRRAARGRGADFDACAVLSREGYTGERKDGAIGFATLRGGDVVGDHTVIFAGTGERIEISHKSGSRAGYAAGSLKAARFLTGKPAGLFSMSDVLGLN
ncbi:MAG: 4-hydroxy-tetrahydrodipicolinate reductase [Duodenibacillus sp.]|nr:4-hydroxy-tetrahydrodipicolinate reductase [Duodenibacillus sp.]